MNLRHLSAGLLIPLVLGACSDNPVLVDANGLVVELTLSDDHVHTLSELSYTVSVQRADGSYVTDFQTLTVERRSEGSDTWRATELALSGDVYTGAYTFMSSGEYELRVMGQQMGQATPLELHRMHDHLEVARAHANVGAYRVEMETFPGHLHEGDQATVKFWVFDPERDASGMRPPISGLTDLQLHCADEAHTPVEESPGVYVTEHTFAEAGEVHLAMHFMDGMGMMMSEAVFTGHVAHGH